MPIEEQAEEKIQNTVQNIITGGAKLALRIPKSTFLALLRSGAKLIKAGTHAAGEAVKNRIDSGEMSEKRLQTKKGGDLHELQLDDSTMRGVQRSLREAGIDYHLERTNDGQYFVHFAGKDEDHIRHAVQRAFRKMGLDITDDDLTVERPIQQEQAQDRNRADTPVRREVRDQPAVPDVQQRIAWDSVEPEVMEMTANTIAARHPELSWGNLMGATTWSERTGREYTDRIISKAASDRTLHNEFEGILRDDYGQGSRTRAQDLGQAAPAHQTAAQPDRTGTAKKSQSGRAQTSNIAPGPKGGTGGPKPIRSKKALLARFKTRLNENLAKQKASPMPSPSRDRTPHKGR